MESNLSNPSNTVGKPMGRPREHNRDQIAIDLIEWAKKSDSINLNKFCAYYDPIIPPSKIAQWAKEDEFFKDAYESAKAFLGFRREEMLNNQTLHVKSYDLNATTYDYFLKEERKEQAKYLADISKEGNLNKDDLRAALKEYSQGNLKQDA